ncbi:MAG: redoxin domain-containing protein [Chloroflexota bacterium]
MSRLVFRMFWIMFLVVALAACGNTATQAPAENEEAPAVAEDEPTEEAMDEEMSDEEGMDEEMSDEAEPMDESSEAMDDEAMEEHGDGTMDEEMSDEEGMDEEMSDEASTEGEMSDESTTEDTEEAAAEPAEGVAEETAEEVVEEPAEAAADRPEWQQLTLTDARTGETFTLADFADKTVYVEPMATWCSNCRQQLGNVSQARAQLDSEQVAFIALSVETNISEADLAAYADEAGFEWTFAVMTPEVLQALTDVFGRTITNPPATPSFIIRTDGTTSDLMTGITAPDVIVEELNAIQES